MSGVEMPGIGEGRLYVMSPAHVGEVLTVEAAESYAAARVAEALRKVDAVVEASYQKAMKERDEDDGESRAACTSEAFAYMHVRLAIKAELERKTSPT